MKTQRQPKPNDYAQRKSNESGLNGRREPDTVRQCALTRDRRPTAELMRFVLDPDGHVVPDLRNRLPGRGVWLTARSDIVASAVAKKVFPKSFKSAAKVDPSLPETIADLLARAALSDLSLANKAGTLVLGFSKIEALADGGTVTALVQASDASEDGRRKLAGRFKGGSNSYGRGMTLITSFKVEELSLALGRPNVVHAALVDGGASAKFVVSASRLDSYRMSAAANAGNPDRGVGEV